MNIQGYTYDGKQRLEVPGDHYTSEIIDTLKKYHPVHAREYDNNVARYWKSDAQSTARSLFDFLKRNVTYKVEPPERQTVKSPGRLLADGYGDCKHYPSFIVGVCDALKRKGYPISARFRFVADSPDRDVHHVFAVVKGAGGEWWCDPVLDTFNVHPKFFNTQEMNGIGAVYYLSGTQAGGIEQTLDTPQKLHAFLARRGYRPADFQNPDQLVSFVGYCMQHPGSTPSPEMFVGNVFDDLKKKVQKVTQDIKKGAQHTAQDIQKGAQHTVQDVKKGAQNTATAVKKGTQHTAKDLQKAAQKTGTALLKVDFAPSRGAFLGLVSINAFNMAHLLRATYLSKDRDRMLAKWKNSAGGDPKALIKAINNGNPKSAHIGVEPISTAAAVALATAMITLMAEFMKGLNMKGVSSAAATGGQAIFDKTVGMQAAKDQGLSTQALTDILQPGTSQGSMDIATGISADGEPVLQVTDVKNPDGSSWSDSTPAGSDAGGNSTGDGIKEWFENAWQKTKDFVSDNKMAVGFGVAAFLILKNKKVKRKLGF